MDTREQDRQNEFDNDFSRAPRDQREFDDRMRAVTRLMAETRFRPLIQAIENYRLACMVDARGMGSATADSLAKVEEMKKALRKIVQTESDVVIAFLARVTP